MARAEKQSIDKTALPSDAVSLAEAAEVVGLSVERLRQLGREGYFTVTRGQASLTAVIAGVVRSLRERSGRDTKSASLSRAQDAKAALLAARTERQRQRLVAKSDADQALDAIGSRALAALKRAPVQGVAQPLRGLVQQEIALAERAITAAVARAKEALATGDMAEIVGDE